MIVWGGMDAAIEAKIAARVDQAVAEERERGMNRLLLVCVVGMVLLVIAVAVRIR